MTNFLISKVVGENPNFEDNKIREKIGYLGGIVGIIVNILLFLVKLSIGILVSSIAVMADAFNNLSDAASSLITILGFKLANRPPDREHPYGHGRIEYISALIVAFMVMLVGVQFIKSSIERILDPKSVVFQLVPFLILLLSIAFKIYLSIFSKKLGDLIDSTSLKATAADALGDVFTTIVVLISLVSANFTSLPIDGYIGLLVAILIIFAGLSLIKETVSPLIGEAPDQELINNIKESVLAYKYITGVHDLVVHNYGPGRTMASIHAEFPSNIDVMEIHEVIDRAERELSDKLDLDLVIHMDPISMDTEEIIESRKEVESIIEDIPEIQSIHDFRIVGKDKNKNLIFDIVIDGNNIPLSEDKRIRDELIGKINEIRPDYNCIITVDREYI